MSETLERTDDLVDHEMLRRWQSDHDAAAERLSAARQALAKAQASHTEAAGASERAAAKGDMDDAHQTQLALEASARGLTVAERVFASASAAMSRSNERRDVVRGLAHRKMYENGILQRVAAARRADAARVELAAAEADYKAATTQMRLAMQNGLPDWHGGAMDGADFVRTEAQERAHWSARDMDPDQPRHGWAPD